MTPPHHVNQALEIRRIAHILGREGAPLDEIEYENAWLSVHDARAQARQMGRLARSQLVGAYDAVDGNVASDAHNVAPSTIFDGEVLVGDTAGERARFNLPDPDLKRGDAGQ